MEDIIDYNNNNISYTIYCDKLSSIDLNKNLLIESSSNNIEFKTNNKDISLNNTIFKKGHTMRDPDLSGIRNIRANTLNVNTVFLTNISNENIIRSNNINYGYIRNTSIGYNNTNSATYNENTGGRQAAYFTYINVSGGDSSFNDDLYISSTLQVGGVTNISNDLIVSGKSFTSLDISINDYMLYLNTNLVSNKILTPDLSATNVSISNDLFVGRTTYLNDVSLSGELFNTILKVPSSFTIDLSEHNNTSGTLIVNGDLIVLGNRTIIESNMIEISDVAISLASNLLNRFDLSTNNAGLDISNVASLKYNGTNWTFSGDNLLIENKKVTLDISLITLKSTTTSSLTELSQYIDTSLSLLRQSFDLSFNNIYTKYQIDTSYVSKTLLDNSLTFLKNYVDVSYISKSKSDLSFGALQTYLDTSYIIKTNFDLSLTFLNSKLDLSYVSNYVFDLSYTSLKTYTDDSLSSALLTNLNLSTINVETIDTKHFSQTFNNDLWNQIGLDISNGPPLTNNNKKVAISNDGKVIAMSTSSHSDISKGRIYVYEISYNQTNQTSSNWTRLGLSSEIIVGVSNNDEFGWDIALSSNGRVVAGSSIVSDASGINCGQVRLFELSSNNVWRQKGSNINGPRINSESGYSISLAGSGNSIAIGAWKDNSNGTNAGAVRVYDFSAAIDDWRQKGQTIVGVSGSYEGYATALSLDGQTLASASIIGATISGGTVTASGGYIIHSFTNVGTNTLTVSTLVTVDYIVVAGGGSGGVGRGGGGGAGGVRSGTLTLSAGSYNITVGAGGESIINDPVQPQGYNGGSSSIDTLVSTTGGGGGGSFSNKSGRNGGSGGGRDANATTLDFSGTGISGEGFGGSGGPFTGTGVGGGGGGAGGIGYGSNGGPGISSTLTGITRYYAGGGGGGGGTGPYINNNGVAHGGTYLVSNGIYGGGNGASTSGSKPIFTDASANTGGGGGGQTGTGPSGAGGSGIVIIRYLRSDILVGQVKTFTISGTTWENKGIIQRPNITNINMISNSYFGRAIKLSGNGNAIVIGEPGYGIAPTTVMGLVTTIDYTAEPVYEVNNTSTTWNLHRTNAKTIYGRDLAVILNMSQNTRVSNLSGLVTNNGYLIGGSRRLTSINRRGNTSLDFEWVTGSEWSYHNFFPGGGLFDFDSEPNDLSNIVVRWIKGYGDYNTYWDNFGDKTAPTGPAIYGTYPSVTNIGPIIISGENIGQAYVYSYMGGTTWTQLGEAIQGISGGDEFGSSVNISNDGTIIAIGSNNNSSNRGLVKVLAYANNYWTQVSNTLSGKTATSKAGLHALSGDGTTLIQTNNTYNSVYGINRGILVLNTPFATISGNLIVVGNTNIKSLDISTNHIFTSNGYSYKIFDLSSSSAIMKEYYSDVSYTKDLKVQITGNGYIYNKNNSYSTISDIRLKENIVDTMPKLEDLLKVRVVNYNLKNTDNTKYIGLIAQELEELFPNLVTELEPSPKDIENGNTIKYKAINYSGFDALLIKSLQEQNAVLKNISQRIDVLENKKL